MFIFIPIICTLKITVYSIIWKRILSILKPLWKVSIKRQMNSEFFFSKGVWTWVWNPNKWFCSPFFWWQLMIVSRDCQGTPRSTLHIPTINNPPDRTVFMTKLSSLPHLYFNPLLFCPALWQWLLLFLLTSITSLFLCVHLLSRTWSSVLSHQYQSLLPAPFILCKLLLHLSFVCRFLSLPLNVQQWMLTDTIKEVLKNVWTGHKGWKQQILKTEEQCSKVRS